MDCCVRVTARAEKCGSRLCRAAARLPSGARSQAVPPSLASHTRGFSATNASAKYSSRSHSGGPVEQAGECLREREQWFSTTLRSIADAVVTVGLGGKVTFISPAAEALIGLRSEEGMGKPAREVLQLVDDRSGEPVQLNEGSLRNLSTGEQRLIRDSAAPVSDDKLALGAVMVPRHYGAEGAAKKA